MAEDRHVSDIDDEDAPIIRIAYTIIKEAIDDGAGEIAVKPGNIGLQIMYRIGDEWRDVMPLPGHISGPLTRRFKLMADMDLTQTKEPQEGRIPIRYADNAYMLAVQTKPSERGEQVNMQFVSP